MIANHAKFMHVLITAGFWQGPFVWPHPVPSCSFVLARHAPVWAQPTQPVVLVTSGSAAVDPVGGAACVVACQQLVNGSMMIKIAEQVEIMLAIFCNDQLDWMSTSCDRLHLATSVGFWMPSLHCIDYVVENSSPTQSKRVPDWDQWWSSSPC